MAACSIRSAASPPRPRRRSLLNLSLIGALIVSVLWLDAPAHALAWGVAAAGLLQFLWLRSRVRREGMAPALRRPRLTPAGPAPVRRLILPGAIGAGVAQINLFIDVVLASLLPPGAVSYLYYADRVNQLPLGVIGVAVGTALLPLMARQLRAGQVAHAMHSQNRALELALLLTVPAALALVVLSAADRRACCSSAARSAPRRAGRPARRSPPTRSACPPTC